MRNWNEKLFLGTLPKGEGAGLQPLLSDFVSISCKHYADPNC